MLRGIQDSLVIVTRKSKGGYCMYCIFNGKTCIMMWDIIAEKYVYIPENVWYSFTEKAKERYTEYKEA